MENAHEYSRRDYQEPGYPPEEALEGVLEYIRFIQEPEEVEPTADEIAIIARGKEEIAKGEVVRWRDIKSELNL